MKIAIISDIHDNLTNLRKCLAWCAKEGVEKIICCGDIANGETLGVLAQEFPGEIFLVRGNMEIYDEDEVAAYKNYTYGGPPSPDGSGKASRTGIFEIDGKLVGVCHEPYFIKEFPSPGGEAASAGAGFLKNIDFIFYGHTHKPWIETRNGVQLVNPGTLGGVFSLPTFAVWDTETGRLELKLLNDLKIEK